MELFIAILIYTGVMTPDSVAAATNADLQFMVDQNRPVIEQVMLDPVAVQAASTLSIDRTED